MSVDLINGIVRILKPNGKTAGTGFVVSDKGLIATCAHVVQYAGAGPGGMVRVAFRATGETREVEVKPEYWRAPNAEDVAILHLQNLPRGVTPLLLGSSGGTATHPFKTFGFPEAKGTEGMFGYGLLGDETTETGFPVLQLTDATEVTVGFSGGPVLNTVTRRVVGMVISITRPDDYGRLTETAFIIPTETLHEICPPLRLSDVCPYRGLAAFTEVDAEFFFGRERLVADLTSHLHHGPRFLAVIGPSGSGKSSVVQAGLLPALRQGKVPGSQDWDSLTFRPGADPFVALTSAGLHSDVTTELQEAINVYLVEHPATNRLVIFADQFEEVFALCPETMRGRFLGQLLTLLDSDLPVTLILALRADFYGHLLNQRPLSEWLALGQVNVLPMDAAELQAAIEKPAGRVGLRFEAGLAETILEEASQVEHPLPLLEAALTRLWEQREEGMLTHAAYQRVGQVAGAISQWAEDTYCGLTEEKLLAQRVLTRLVHYSEGGTADTRQRRPLAELVTHPQELETVHELVQRLANARLLVTDRDPCSGEETAEIIHDALLWEWRRLRLWVEQQRAFYLWRQRLNERLREWKDRDQDEGVLLRGILLNEAESWLSSRPDELNPEERRYIQNGVALQERERAARERLRRRIVLGLVIALAVTIGLASLWWWQRSEAVDAEAAAVSAEETAVAQADARATEVVLRATAQADAEWQALMSRSRELANAATANLEVDPELSLLLAAEAAKTVHNSESEDALRRALLASQVRATIRMHGASGQYRGGGGSSAGADMVSFSPDGKLLIAVGHGSARISSVPDGIEVVSLDGYSGNVITALFSPDGKRIVTGSSDGAAQVWDAVTGQLLWILKGHNAGVNIAVFAPDGLRVATASEDGTAILWDATQGSEICILQGHEDEAESAIFSPDGLWIATGSRDSTARVWQASTCRQELVLQGHTQAVTRVVYSPDGQWIATASEDMTARLWNAQSGAQIYQLSDHFGPVYDADFSSDGNWLVTGAADNTARVWDLATGSSRLVLLGHEGVVTSVAFSSDDQWIVTSGLHDNTARIWDAATGRLAAVLRGHTARVNQATISPDGRWVATASEDGTARIWSTTAYEVGLFPGYAGRSDTISFDRDREKLATVEASRFDASGHDATGEATRVWIWNLATGKRVANWSDYDRDTEVVAFSPDTRWLATGHSATGMIRIWETTSGLRVAEWKAHGGRVSDLLFTPDNRWLVSAGIDGSIHVWESQTWREAFVFPGETKPSLALSPNGRWLSGTYEYPDALRIWDTASWSEVTVSTAYTGSDVLSNYSSISFSPDSRWLALTHLIRRSEGGDGGLLRIWDTASWTTAYDFQDIQPIDRAFFSAGSGLVVFNAGDDVKIVATGSWEDIALLKGHEDSITDVDFSKDMLRIATSSYDGTGRVWDISTGQLVASLIHEDSIFDISFSPNGERIVTACEDGTVRLWEATTGRLVADLGGHSGSVYDSWFSADGRRIITVGSGEVRVYAAGFEDLLQLARSRLTREFTCEERVRYLQEEIDCLK